MAFLRDQRGVIMNWLGKLVLLLAIFGVIAFAGGAILFNYFTLDSAVDDAAVALSLAIETDEFGTNDEQVVEAAKTLLETGQVDAAGAKVVEKETHVDEAGIIYVKLRRVASTLI